ncbi:SDR family oxidoreductase [Nocardioides sp.]|uniref:SDR family oxidoreductase n=1 Tax=Nocardioides sp. TaxID=35761 RepID=UPI00262C1A7D|nr:SDR family oxidoreductase [Nocardioides sp.]
MASRVLVTGGSGFLGSSVVPQLAAAGLAVTSGDIRPPRTETPGVRYVDLDVTSAETVAAAVAGHDVVIHLASIVTPPPGLGEEAAYRVDVDGSKNVIAACLASGVRRLVVSSSGAAYGYHADSPAWIDEEQPVRGNDAFAYAKHKRLVEEELARTRAAYPHLEQVVLRIGTILGATVDNQITDLFHKKRLLKIAGARSPFVFIWDEDLAQIVVQAATGEVSGTFNVAGDGALTIDQIAARLGKKTLPIPEPVLRAALAVLHPLRLSQYGPEQTKFLQYRPVLANSRLKETFGYTPAKTSAEAFDAWLASHPAARA